MYYGSLNRGGFIAKVKGFEHPIPIGSLGDGMWRMLAMAIAITQCKGGFLLIDEIDTGLHYTVMADMWKLIYNAAKEFDVQVFATTHSNDCVYSLAPVCPSNADENNVTVQRIEAGKFRAVPYSEIEIKIAAEKGLELR
jgi:AAA15 family ATPase/GTPase